MPLVVKCSREVAQFEYDIEVKEGRNVSLGSSSAIKISCKVMIENLPNSWIVVSLIGIRLAFNPNHAVVMLPLFSVITSLAMVLVAVASHSTDPIVELRDKILFPLPALVLFGAVLLRLVMVLHCSTHNFSLEAFSCEEWPRL